MTTVETNNAIAYANGTSQLLNNYFAQAMKWAQEEGKKEADRIWNEVWK